MSARAWFSNLSKGGKATVAAITGVLLFGAIGAMAQPAETPKPAASQATITETAKPEVKPTPKPQSKVEKKNEEKREVARYTSSTVNDATLAQGTTQMRNKGVDGVRTIVFEVTYTDGVETARQEVGSTITTAPANEVIAIGTMVPQTSQSNCPDGTYVNSAGNVVCSPYQSSSAPAGATAKCRDGTYSFSQSRRGTCSSHGGVAEWL